VGYEHRARGVAGDDPRGRHHPIRLPRVAGRCLLGRMLAGSHSLRAGIPAPRALIAPASSLRAPPCAHGRVRRQESPGLAVSGAARRGRSELARSEEQPPKAERRATKEQGRAANSPGATARTSPKATERGATKEQGSGRSCGRFWGGLGGYVAWKLRVFPVRPHAHTRDRNPDLGRGGRFLDGPLASCQPPAGVPVALAVRPITTL